MDNQQFRFDDGAAYEDFMGKWSQLAGEVFLDWLAPPAQARWADVGCGNGAFTELLIRRCAAREVQGIDPSEEQIAFARSRLPGSVARFQLGDAMALPYADGTLDAAVMALVIFFVPEPARGVAEMVRVVRPGGSVSAYAWDMLGGGFPFAVILEEFEALGSTPLLPPSVEASRAEVMRALWAEAGLVEVETRVIEVERSFADFETFWRIALTGPRIAPRIATMTAGDVETLKARVRARLPAGADGRLTLRAFANAVRGRRPA
jgi:ubiquinone/menaquinone biosynthesis C-methylase UbiE